MFSQACVKNSVHRVGGLFPNMHHRSHDQRVSVQGVSVRGVSVQGGLCLGGVSVQHGVSVREGLCPGGLCPGGLCLRGVSCARCNFNPSHFTVVNIFH